VRFGWGLFDFEVMQVQTPGYTTAQIKTAGDSAVIGDGVGVRSCTITIDRTGVEAGLDPASMHFDFLNITSGAADDTWTTTDFTTLETLISAFFSSVQSYMPNGHSVTQYSWHRKGHGITKPNPAVRLYTLPSAITGTGGTTQPLQTACSITFRTGVRKSWGRTYLPSAITLGANRRPSAGPPGAIAAAADTLVTGAASADFLLVVVSKTLSSALAVERVEVDDVTDVIRRRRHKKATYRSILPAP